MPKRRNDAAHVQALHLAGIQMVDVGQRTQCAAAGELAIDQCQQQCARRRTILARQRGELGFEVLERQVDAELARVLAHDLARGVDLVD
jgi:hypothetical protein